MQNLGISLEGCGGVSGGYDINNSSQVTGVFESPVPGGCIPKAFIYSNGETLVIGDLLPGFGTIGRAINDSGQVVMQAGPLEGTNEEGGGYLYTDGSVERIGLVIPWGINNSGWVVGTTGIGGLNARAFLYIDGELFDLTELVTDLSGLTYLISAYDINDSGQIIGEGRTPGGASSAFLLSPIAIKVRIDIKPGSKKTRINLRSKGNIPVAILSTESFDATQVDWETVTFGPDGATESHGRSHVEDVDRDGDMDVLLHFDTQDTGIQCGDTEVTLTGETFDGQSFTGSDAIETVNCS
jgi:probable HAF family extracellular repeat protein